LLHCEKCHDASGWHMLAGAAFDHRRDTRFALEKRHRAVTCAGCHAATTRRLPPLKRPAGALPFELARWRRGCAPCHENVHGESFFGRLPCARCHSSPARFATVELDHARTGFPLAGAHARASCDSCHRQNRTSAPGTACVSCHRDVHRGRFGDEGQSCEACHAPTSWDDRSRQRR
jgi:hypothetical protein